MPCTFSAVFNPPRHLIDAIANLTPENPFYTSQYLDARKKLGSEVCSLTLESPNGLVSGCSTFLSRGRLNSRLEITSLPVLADQRAFWDGVFGFCRKQKISVLSVHTFASTEAAIIQEEDLVSLKRRSEFRLDLMAPDLWKLLNRRSQRLVKKAASHGLSIRRDRQQSAREAHVSLANMSLERVRTRGESVNSRIEMSDINAYLDCGAGELIQAVKDDEIYASIFVARSQKGGYAQSSGSSAIGREIGASHFLFYETACLLKSEDLSVLNLGGADDKSKGLQDFKLGLGGEKIELESAEFFTGSIWKRLASGAVDALKNVARRN